MQLINEQGSPLHASVRYFWEYECLNGRGQKLIIIYCYNFSMLISLVFIQVLLKYSFCHDISISGFLAFKTYMLEIIKSTLVHKILSHVVHEFGLDKGMHLIPLYLMFQICKLISLSFEM